MGQPDWRDIVSDSLARKTQRVDRRSIAINYPPSLYALVLEAARGRGMSLASFQRRASLAVARHDLGFDWFTELACEPSIISFIGERSVVEPGAGFGPWLIDTMRDGRG